VKYLGVTLDPKISWSHHCKLKAKHGTTMMAQCRRAVGLKWGFSPKVMLWLYTAVVRSTISYAGVVWCTATIKKTQMNPLIRSQRLALICISGCFRGTSTESLECILGILPIYIHIQMLSINTQKRLTLNKGWPQWNEVGALTTLTHRKLIDRWSGGIEILNFPCNPDVEKLDAMKLYQTAIRSRRDWHQKGMPFPSPMELFCYTDSSGIDGNYGAAFHIPQLSLD